jgi:hypothetical protein
MPRTSVAAQTPVGPVFDPALSADDLQITMTAGDVANGNTVPLAGVGRFLMLVLQNTSADTDYYVTVGSVADEHGRDGDITQYDVNFGSAPEVVILPRALFQQSDGGLDINVENAAVEFAVLVLP